MAVIINRPKITKTPNTVVIPREGKLFDPETAPAYIEPPPEPVIEEKKESEVNVPETTEVKKEEPAVVSTTANQPVFSWENATKEKEEKPATEAPTRKVVAEVKAASPEYVIVEETPPPTPPPPEKPSVKKKAGNFLTWAFIGIASFLGLKTGFEYYNDAESQRYMNWQLEQEIQEYQGVDPEIQREVRKYESQFNNKFNAERIFEDAEHAAGSVLGDITTALIGDKSIKRVIRAKPFYLLIERKDGKIELRTGGSIGWRTNNPGEIGWGNFAQATGAVGKYEQFAVYPSMKVGMEAIGTYLFSTNRFVDLSINDAMKKFYSSSSKAERVAKRISVVLNISRYKTYMRNLSSSQRRKVLDVIQKEEKVLEGIVRTYKDMDEFNAKGF